MHSLLRFPSRPAAPARLSVRPIREGDAPLLRGLFDGLSAMSRLRRFHAGVVSLPERWLERLAHPDPRTEAVLLAVVVENGREVAVGEARHALDAEPAWPASGAHEFAIVVADPWRRRGLGDALTAAIEADALQRGLRRLHGDVQHDNRPMLSLLEQRGWAIRRHPRDPGLARATLELAPFDAVPAGLADLDLDLELDRHAAPRRAWPLPTTLRPNLESAS